MQKHNHSDSKRKLRIASRGSKLALWQARYVESLLGKKGLASEITIVKTTGDRVQDKMLHEIGGKGVFIKEVEQTLWDGHADIAVHSLKDMPAVVPEGFTIASVLPRHAPGDLLILKPKTDLEIEAKQITPAILQQWGAIKIGTGSLRRANLLKEASHKVIPVPIRGNVDTRLDKLRAGTWDAIILAAASLERLDTLAQGLVCLPFESSWFVPSPSQGALAIETLADFSAPELAGINCDETHAAVNIERRILAALGADCQLPVGLHAQYVMRAEGRCLKLSGVVLNNEGKSARSEGEWKLPYKQEEICQEFLEDLKANGVNEILRDLDLKTI